MIRFLQRQWFLCALLAVFGLSAVLPPLPNGDWQRSAKLMLVFLIFLFSGISLRTGELLKSFFNLRLHLFIQILSLLVLPLIMMAIVNLLEPLGLPDDFLLGLLILGALPTTITSCVAFTTLAGGNVAGALVNASLGNLLGIVITPLWLMLYTKGTPFQKNRNLLLEIPIL
jgi:solute carrier family 10 (sodium/bile acid cotransporter), member 7